MSKKILIAQPRISQREVEAVARVLKSGHLRSGPITEKFERDFARFVGAHFAVAVNSGTSALFLALSALVRPGDDVIVPDFSFVATASMVVAAGARPIFSDVNPQTFTLDVRDAARRITPRTRAMVPVHLYGRPADVAPLMRLARQHRLKIIWDAAQAHGAQYHGRDVGSFPDAVCYSFYPTKNITTGEGGMIVTSNARLAQQLRLARSHGEAERYRHVRLGYNFRLTDFAAALGLEQLRDLKSRNRRRQLNAAILRRGLEKVRGIELPAEDASIQHVYNSFTILVNARVLGMTRDEFRRELAKRGVETSVHYPLPLSRQPLFRGLGNDCPISQKLARSVLSLPVHPQLNRADLKRIVQAVREVTKAAVR